MGRTARPLYVVGTIMVALGAIATFMGVPGRAALGYTSIELLLLGFVLLGQGARVTRRRAAEVAATQGPGGQQGQG